MVGYTVYDADPRVLAWAQAAHRMASKLDTSERRHGDTWFVGVDALDNAPDGSVDGVPLAGPWDVATDDLHRAQVSIVYPGYPRQDADESDVAHRFRVKRDAAHMDGLLPEGAAKRRHLREPHAYILGVTLNDVAASPLVVWPDSHKIMRAAFVERFAGIAPDLWAEEDVTDAYQTARRRVFETCTRVPVPLRLGQAVLLDRHLIHGVAPWDGGGDVPRIVAYFRPQCADVADWL